MFSDTFAGISPSSVPSFVAAQVVGGALAVIVIKVLYPDITPAEAADIMFPHSSGPDSTDPSSLPSDLAKDAS
jgi:glycerol uptake facilitator-like aquaporin